MSKLKVKTMMIYFFDSKRIVHHELVPPVKLSTNISTKKYSIGCKNVLLESVQRLQKHGSSIMIMIHALCFQCVAVFDL